MASHNANLAQKGINYYTTQTRDKKVCAVETAFLGNKRKIEASIEESYQKKMIIDISKTDDSVNIRKLDAVELQTVEVIDDDNDYHKRIEKEKELVQLLDRTGSVSSAVWKYGLFKLVHIKHTVTLDGM
jgi:hypothetical protein